MPDTETAEGHLVELAQQVRQAELDLLGARVTWDEAVAAAVRPRGDLTVYRVAQITGVSNPAVAAARDRGEVLLQDLEAPLDDEP